MILSIIVAMDEEGGIGKNGRLPWHLHTDLQRFKRITMGHTLVMGRKTYESIGRALPGRTTIIVTRSVNFKAPGCLVASSLEQALEIARALNETEVFVIGGGQIFALALAKTERIHLTRVHADTDCQVFFPRIDWQEWNLSIGEFVPASEQDQYASTYYLLERREPGHLALK